MEAMQGENMNGKKYSIIIVPTSGGKSLQFSISGMWLYAAAVVILAVFSVNAFFTYGFFAKAYQHQTIADLIDENEFLISRVSYFSSEIENLKEDYSLMVDKEKELRTIFNLPMVDDQERALGIGGPVFSSEETLSNARQITYDAENRLDELVRLSSFEIEQYDTIYRSLMNKKKDLDHTPSIMPSSGYITRGFGVRPDPFTGIKRMHSGIDVCNREGTPIYASANGRVKAIRRMGHLGITLIMDHGNGIETYYGHILKATVNRGQTVKRGDKIAEMGNSGRSTGPHLHYAVKKKGRWVNPMDYILNQNWLADIN
jgi:murein DD-endopeptidase MepM/ murein hydrolase activator NlpD